MEVRHELHATKSKVKPYSIDTIQVFLLPMLL